MSDKPRQVKVSNGQEMNFTTALYYGACAGCGGRLPWEAHFDADGTQYHAGCCGRHYVMSPHTVTIGVSMIPGGTDE